jgi:pimeloyl-ACP methyl ester carboxylesterase
VTTRIVLVHGTMDRSSSFAKLRPHLGGFEVVAYDRRGYGHARHLAAASLDDHIGDLLEQIGDQPAVVVGHSLGGNLALAAATIRPDLVRSVGAWEAPLAWLPWWPEGSAGTRAVAEGLAPADAGELFMRGVAGDDVWERLPEATRQARREEGAAMLIDVRGVRAGPPFVADAVRVPVVAGCGGDSKPYHRKSAEWLAGNLADAELFEIAGARHGAHASHPAEFAAFVRRTVDRANAR